MTDANPSPSSYDPQEDRDNSEPGFNWALALCMAGSLTFWGVVICCIRG